MKELKFKLNDIKFDGIEFNNINMFVGQNGSGKSLVNKLTWLSHMIANTIIISKEHNLGDNNLLIEDLIRKTLYDSETIELEVLANFHKGFINIIFKENKLSFLDYDLEKYEISKPNYLSTNTRQFNQITQILNNDKLIKGEYKKVEDVLVPAYDLLASLLFKQSFDNKFVEFRQDSVERFKEHYNLDIIALKCNEDNTFTMKDSSGKERSCYTLSNGEQALLVMMAPLSI